MSSLRKAGLGPIVGHTTHKSCRIWIRAEDTHDEATDLSSEHRTIGIAAIVREDGRKLDPGEIEAFYFRLHREMDRTGVYDLGMGTCLSGKEPGGALRADTEYVARAGTLVIDDPFRDDQNVSSDDIASRLPDPNVWVEDLLSLSPKHSRARFKTFPDPDNDERRDVAFLLGSCRYPGLLWKIKEADKIFGPVYREATRGSDGAPDDRGARRSVDFSLMVGDQIYADMLNRNISIGLADTFEEFQERYLTAFGSRNMRKLLRSVMMKGLAAVVIEALAGGHAAGDAEWLWQNLAGEIEQGDADWLARLVTGTGAHAVRRIGEMEAAVELLDELGANTSVTIWFTERRQLLPVPTPTPSPVPTPSEPSPTPEPTPTN